MTDITAKAEQVLAGLKDFQRSTVEHVFERLYGPTASRRFLVADEVGLGKTLIAKGVVAKAVDHLRRAKGPDHRIDVLYLCSNGDIARQNMKRLTLPGESVTPLASRLTLLPLHIGQLAERKLNFVSFTPATSFDLRDGLGKSEERVLLYWMLRRAWDLGSSKAAVNVFQGHVTPERFRRAIEVFDPERIDPKTQKAFTAALHGPSSKAAEGLRDAFEELCSAYARVNSTPSKETARGRSAFVGRLRAVLARACVASLELDLVILDEFQRSRTSSSQEKTRRPSSRAPSSSSTTSASCSCPRLRTRCTPSTTRRTARTTTSTSCAPCASSRAVRGLPGSRARWRRTARRSSP